MQEHEEHENFTQRLQTSSRLAVRQQHLQPHCAALTYFSSLMSCDLSLISCTAEFKYEWIFS